MAYKRNFQVFESKNEINKWISTKGIYFTDMHLIRFNMRVDGTHSI